MVRKSVMPILLATILVCAIAPSAMAETSDPTCVSVVQYSNRTINAETSYKTLYIAKNNILTVRKPLTVTGNVYVFGRLDNYSTITVKGTVYCLKDPHGNKVANYGSGNLTNGAVNANNPNARINGKVSVTSSYLSLSIPSPSHKSKEVRGKIAATCTSDGQTGSTYCTICGDLIRSGEYVKALGHNWDDGVQTKEPSLDGPGVITYSCSRCSEHKYDSIPNVSIINDAIASLGEPSLSQAGIVESIRKACDALDEEQKAEIVGYNAFVEIEHAVEDLKLHDMAYATIALPNGTYTFNGKAYTPKPTVKAGEQVLQEGIDYTLEYANNVNAGNASLTITGANGFTGSITKHFKIGKATPNITVKKTLKKFKAKAASKAKQRFAIGAKASNNSKLTYKVVKSNKTITFKNGKITLKKGKYKKGKTYSIKVKISCKETANYKASSKTVKLSFKAR